MSRPPTPPDGVTSDGDAVPVAPGRHALHEGDASLDMEQRLDRQLERGGVRTQQLLNRSFERLSELEAILLGLVDHLVAAGAITPDELAVAAGRVEAEMAARGDGQDHLVTLREDPAGDPPEPAIVDCATRMPVCHGICCRLSVALSAEEVETGRLRWDLGNPYRLRREADGRCTHQDRASGFCGVYDDRPRPCRTYTCATDPRIWKDFEAMELNEEWLAAQEAMPDGPRFVAPPSRRRQD